MIVYRMRMPPAGLARIQAMPERVRAASIRLLWWSLAVARNHVYDVGFGGRPHLISQRGELGLRGSVTQRVEDHWPRLSATLGSNLVYARIHELGGTIKAVRAKYLRFQVGGHWAMKAQVTIPPRPYLRPALEQAGKFITSRANFLAAWQQVGS